RTILYLLIHFIGQYLDASIGLGYGTITAPLLLLLGVPPIYTVPAILLSKTVLGVLSGGIHQIAGNVQSKIVLSLTLTGVFGTLLGALISFFLPDRDVSVFIGIVLMVTGGLSLLNVVRGVIIGRYSQNKIRVYGFFAGFANGISGGGYGAISVTGLVSAGVDARVAVGSTVLSETVVALGGSCYTLLFYEK
ncbi:MAG: sulfite exporter TauE/SafE family protein, partial [Candidatus Hodarchaeota archaeon]